MLSYYRALFDIRSATEGLTGLSLMDQVEEVLRGWVHESFPEHKDILDGPGDARSGRMWDKEGALLRLSGATTGNTGYFWLRWHVDDDDGADYRRYLGFRLATEGDAVQADVEVKVEDNVGGHFDAELQTVMNTLLSGYRCSILGTGLSQDADHVSADCVETIWERIASAERCLPIVMVTEKRGGGMPLDGDALQRDLLGLAQVVCCSDDAAWRLGWYSWRLLCYDGQVRVYSPGLSFDDDESRHRCWGFEDVSQLGDDIFLQLLRDECAQRIRYPAGRDALRVFSRVRGRVREQIRSKLSQENQQVYDEWAEEVAAKDAEIKRQETLNRQIEADNAKLIEQLEGFQRDNRSLRWRLNLTENRLSQGYNAPAVGGEENVRSSLRSVGDVLAVAKDLQYVRVFEEVGRDSGWISKGETQKFYDLLMSLDGCGAERADLRGASEESWMRDRGFRFAGRESPATMQEYGDLRRFRDDDGMEVEMQPHLRVEDLRVYVRWSPQNFCWLVGYFGKHLPTASA